MAKKKQIRKVASAAKPQAAMQQPAEFQYTCSRRRCCLKKLIILIFGIAIGAVVSCKFYHCSWGHGKGMFGHGARFETKFVNGCLNTSGINCPEKMEKVQMKDADKNGCITEEEFFGAKKMDVKPRGKAQ